MPSEATETEKKKQREQANAPYIEYQRSKDVNLRNRLVEENLPLVNALIKKFLNKGADYEDLYQVGALALVYAVERFDAVKGYSFASFATPTILGEIKRFFRDKCWAVKVPRRQKELAGSIPAAKETLRQSLLRNPTVTEIAAHLEVSVEDVLEAMESGSNYQAISLNQALEESTDGDVPTLEKFTGVEEDGYEDIEGGDVVQTLMKELSDREKDVFKGRFIQNRTQTQVAADLDVSQMMVSRIEKKIKQKFRTEFYR
jgi:RNA polymerase sigma-B factor